MKSSVYLLSVFGLFITLITQTKAVCYIGQYHSYCDDFNMFGRCLLAQNTMMNYIDNIINVNKTYELLQYVPQIDCYQHMSCYGICGYGYYQNMDSYDLCSSMATLLDEFVVRAQLYTKIPDSLLNNRPQFKCTKLTDPNVCDYYVNPPNSGAVIGNTCMSFMFALFLVYFS